MFKSALSVDKPFSFVDGVDFLLLYFNINLNFMIKDNKLGGLKHS